MKASDYLKIKTLVSKTHADEIKWAKNVKLCSDPDVFLKEYMWVVVNSGLKNQVAQKIYARILDAIADRKPIKNAFRHPGKAAAITRAIREYEEWFKEYQAAEDKLLYLEQLPWIGKITKFHLARNLGLDVCKPDRHLVRIASKYNTTTAELCRLLAADTGDRIGLVDAVIWRAANLGLI